MQPQIIGISGSPIKNSNTDRLIHAVLESSGLSSEFVKLSKINVRPCIACLGCKKDNICKVKDDFPELAEKVRHAGAVVVGGYSPYGAVDGFTKAFLERLFSLRHQNGLNKGKHAVVVATGIGRGAPGLEEASNQIAHALNLEGMNVLGQLKVTGNPTVSQRYSFLNNLSKDYFQKIELDSNEDWRKVFENIPVQLKAIRVNHHDLSSRNISNTYGLIIKFDNFCKVGITSDTFYDKRIIKKFVMDDLDVLMVHINGCPFREMVTACLEKGKIKIENMNLIGNRLQKELLYSLGYDNIENEIFGEFAMPLGKQVDTNWESLFNQTDSYPLGMHLLLYGTLKAFDLFCEQSPKYRQQINKERLFIISETNEEMENYRHKVSQLMNKYKASQTKNRCFTTDIEFCARISKTKKNSYNKIEIKCSHCSLSNDYHENDQYHPISEINEVCLKQEEEGLFYFCNRHDPVISEGIKREEYRFIERLERFQPFRHIDIRL